MTVTSPLSKRIPLWLDCDPGHDDAVALLLGCFSPYYDLLGVSTVHGNASLQRVTTNAISLLTAFEKYDIGVYPGAEKPLKLSTMVQLGEDIHGESGLDGSALMPSPAFEPNPDHSAVNAMVDAIEKYPNEIALCATGTLTNVANLFDKRPDLVSKIKYLSIMGGGIEIGNSTPYSEYNIWCDPDAAKKVLTNKDIADRTMLVPIDVTHTAIATEQVLSVIKGNGEKLSLIRQMLFELLTFFAGTYNKRFTFTDGPPVHDPMATVALIQLYGIDNDLELEYERYDLDVTLEGERQGQIVLEGKSESGVMILKKANIDNFWAIVYEAVENVSNHVTKM